MSPSLPVRIFLIRVRFGLLSLAVDEFGEQGVCPSLVSAALAHFRARRLRSVATMGLTSSTKTKSDGEAASTPRGSAVPPVEPSDSSKTRRAGLKRPAGTSHVLLRERTTREPLLPKKSRRRHAGVCPAMTPGETEERRRETLRRQTRTEISEAAFGNVDLFRLLY